jgi:hypothetical protein
MKTLVPIRALFIVAGLYDGILGIAFLIAAPSLFSQMGIPGPSHWGYIHFPAMLLIVFALAFFAVAQNPHANRNLIPFGIALKLSYCSTVFYNWFASGVPNIWKPFAFVDLLFLLLFIWAYAAIARQKPGVTT